MRLYYLDYLRSLLVILSIVIYASMGYVSAIPLVFDWYVPGNGHIFFDYVVVFLDTVIPSCFFFIAGYFAYPSWEKRDNYHFIKEKFIRLIIPFGLVLIFLNPYAKYVMQQLKGNTTNYLVFYIFDYLSIFQYYLYQPSHWMVVWLLPILFFYYLVFLFIQPYIKKIRWSSSMLLVVIGISTSICYYIIQMLDKPYSENPSFFGGFPAQSARFPLYFAMFVLGIITFRNQKHITFKKINQAMFFSLFFTLCNTAFFVHFLPEILVYEGFRAIHAILYCFGAVLSTIALVAFFKKWLNTRFEFLEMLCANSYVVYLLQFNIVIYFQKFFLGFDTPIYVSWPLIILGSLIISFTISQYGLKRISLLNRMLY